MTLGTRGGQVNGLLTTLGRLASIARSSGRRSGERERVGCRTRDLAPGGCRDAGRSGLGEDSADCCAATDHRSVGLDDNGAVVVADQGQCRAELVDGQAECFDVGMAVAADVDGGLAVQVLVPDAVYAVVPFAFEVDLVCGILDVPHDSRAVHDCEADTLARAKGTSVDGVKTAGVIEAGGGNVRLLKWKEYPADWNPSLDTRLPVWEALHHLIRAYSSKGDVGAGKVLKAFAGKAEAARQLAYRLYTLCERKGWAEDARAYNEVVTGWSGIERAAGAGGEEQRELFNG